MDLTAIRALVDEDLRSVDQLIRERLHSDVALVNELSSYILNSGGKRLRPLLVLLSARAFGYQGQAHILLAAIIEFIHTATLLHDDVVDGSELRRGNDTANALYGNEASVLVGDFLYSRAFQMMVDVDDMRVMRIMADTTNMIAEGEVLQLLHCQDPDITEEQYRRVIHAKTARLFQTGAQLGAIISGAEAAQERAISDYGQHLGVAFQLVDDVLDYCASSEDIGKNVGDDLAEGKTTLPLIHAMREGNAEQSAVVRQAVEEAARERIDEVLRTIESTGAITYTSRSAAAEGNLAIAAIDGIPDSTYKDALRALAEFSVHRSH